MRFVHISDIHLGKLLYQQNLLVIQADFKVSQKSFDDSGKP